MAWLGFGRTEPTIRETPAPAASGYPTSEDVEMAKKYGFFDQVYEPFSKGQIARVLGTEQTSKDPKTKRTLKQFVELAGVDVGADAVFEDKMSKVIESNPQLADTLAKGFLAANRIPVAALGWNPEKVILDVKSGKNVTVAGMYDPQKDAVYANSEYQSTPVHEAIHRGIEILRKKHPEFFEKNPLPREEFVVRYLMATQAGNPEKGRGKRADEQISEAMRLFDNSNVSKLYLDSLKKLTRLAEDELGTRNRRRGPD